jgi:hypothetical protein
MNESPLITFDSKITLDEEKFLVLTLGPTHDLHMIRMQLQTLVMQNSPNHKLEKFCLQSKASCANIWSCFYGIQNVCFRF